LPALSIPPTPAATLIRARNIAMRAGLQYVYTGNVHNREGDTTFCPGCQAALIERDWYRIEACHLRADGCCAACGTAIAGHFDDRAGTFGRKRIPLRISG
jgi:pyruvate formate lyase activating enzyme